MEKYGIDDFVFEVDIIAIIHSVMQNLGCQVLLTSAEKKIIIYEASFTCINVSRIFFFLPSFNKLHAMRHVSYL